MHVHPKMSCFLALSALLLTPMAAALDTQPNVILVMTDDQGHGDLSLHGNPCLQTPNLDRLAAQSARLGTFYVQPKEFSLDTVLQHTSAATPIFFLLFHCASINIYHVSC